MDGKYFWVLECGIGPRPFYAKPDGSWTWNRSDAQKFIEPEEAREFRRRHPELREYRTRIYDFSDDPKFKDEPTQLNF
jgi:hypothetical protein